MTKTTIILFALLCASWTIQAQTFSGMSEEIENMGSERQVDSTLLGRDIYSLLGESVTIRQSAELRSGLEDFSSRGAAEQFNGFRVRIYLDSTLGARDASLNCIRRFNAMYPGVLAFRSYSAPNYKVTVGNFRTKLEAERLLSEIRGSFPQAFVVRDKFKYPSLGRPELNITADSELAL